MVSAYNIAKRERELSIAGRENTPRVVDNFTPQHISTFVGDTTFAIYFGIQLKVSAYLP